jgi:hypothetical protein
MTESELKYGPAGGESIEAYTAAIQLSLRKIQSRNWWSWSNMVVVVLLLTCAIVSFTLPTLLQTDDFSQLNLNLAMRGLIGLVLIFSIYSLFALAADSHQGALRRDSGETSQRGNAL